jgi:hypothetical protein
MAPLQLSTDCTPYLQGLYTLFPLERIEKLVRQASRRQRRRRRLPADHLVWLMIALGLYASHSIPQVWQKLQPSQDQEPPTDAAFHQARRRLGIRPLRDLWRDVVHPLGQADTPGCFYRHWRLIGLDGSEIDLPDSPALRRAFPRSRNQHNLAAFPRLRLMGLCELGTHVLFDIQMGTLAQGETTLAVPLLQRLPPQSLVLLDRGLSYYGLVQQIRLRHSHVLGRVKAKQRELPLICRLADGSYLSMIYPGFNARRQHHGGIAVRVIRFTHTDPQRPGREEPHCLITTILDPRLLPAADAIALYHQRWECESALDEIKTHLFAGREPLLRSRSPRLAVQELVGVLLTHYLLRWLMVQAARQAPAAPTVFPTPAPPVESPDAPTEQEKHPLRVKTPAPMLTPENAVGLDPDRMSFTHCLRTVQARLPEAPHLTAQEWLQRLLREVARAPLHLRRQRCYPRQRKSVKSRWKKKTPDAPTPRRPRPYLQTVKLLI